MVYEPGTTTKIYTALGRADGGFATPVLAWESTPNSWHTAS